MAPAAPVPPSALTMDLLCLGKFSSKQESATASGRSVLTAGHCWEHWTQNLGESSPDTDTAGVPLDWSPATWCPGLSSCLWLLLHCRCPYKIGSCHSPGSALPRPESGEEQSGWELRVEFFLDPHRDSVGASSMRSPGQGPHLSQPPAPSPAASMK